MAKKILKVSQPMQALLGIIGEQSALLKLSLITMGSGWEAFQHIDARGYDMLLRKKKNGTKNIKIEVKTRQMFRTSALEHNKTSAYFGITAAEANSATFLVAIWWEFGWIFVVPMKHITEGKKAKKALSWRVSISKSTGLPGMGGQKYLENWSLLDRSFSNYTLLRQRILNELALSKQPTTIGQLRKKVNYPKKSELENCLKTLVEQKLVRIIGLKYKFLGR